MFLGLDLSIRATGIALIDKNYKILHTDKLQVRGKGIERLFHLDNLFSLFLDKFPEIQFTCLEGPSFQSKEGNIFQLGEWTGLVKLNLFRKNINFIIAAPSQLKKFISGKFEKEAKKELIILDIYKKYNIELRDNDIADAYVLARIAHDYWIKYCVDETYNHLIEELKKYQIEVLKKIHTSQLEQQDVKLL